MLCLVIIGLSHPAYVWWYCRKGTEEIKRSLTYDTHIKTTTPLFSDIVISNEDQGPEVMGCKIRISIRDHSSRQHTKGNNDAYN